MPDQPIIESHACAEAATFQAFLNCYLREVNPGTLLPAAGPAAPRMLELALPHTRTRLRVTLDYLSQTGPHRFGEILVRHGEAGAWRLTRAFDVLPMLVQDCCIRSKTADGYRLPELLRRVLNSYDQMERIARAHASVRAPAAARDFLAAEQALVFGHWLHPTPKSREGMSDWHQPAYAPELGGSFQLTFFAAHTRILRAGSALPRPATALVGDIPGLHGAFALGAGEALIPMHPLQAEALRLDPRVGDLIADGGLRELGPAGCPFHATSSLRTVYAPESPWMLKFSLPVQITNSRRINLFHELEAGVLMARLLSRIGFAQSHRAFRVIDDPAYLSIALPGRRESGFEVIFRANPFAGNAGRGIVNLAALTADPLPGRASMLAEIVADLAADTGATPEATALAWFDAYLGCALRPLLELYDRHGIALEAHQQNSLVDVSAGLPTRAWFRDNQGYYIAEDHFDRLAALEPALVGIPALCFPRAVVNDRLCYYLIVNQIFAVISRLGRDGLGPEARHLDRLARALEGFTRSTGPAGDFARQVLSAPHLAAKANLLTRVHDIDELQATGETAVYVHLPNPIAAAARRPAHEEPNVFA